MQAISDLCYLEDEIKLAIGAKVMITNNIWCRGGISNGTLGTIIDIIYDGQ